MSVCKIIKIILTVKGKVTVTAPVGDVQMAIEPGLAGTFDMVLHNNSNKDIPVTMVASALTGVAITPTNAVAKPGDTTVTITVGVAATVPPADYTLEITVSQ